MKHPKIYLFSGDPNDPADGFYIPEGYNINVESWAPIPLPAVEPSIAINLALQLKRSGGEAGRLVRGLVDALIHELSHWGES